MSAVPSGPDSFASRFRRLAARVRPGHVLAAVGLSVVVGMVGLQAVALPGPRPLTETDRLKIEVVPPVEPEIVAGSVMDVGELIDGFEGVPRAPVVEAVAYKSYDDGDDWREAPEPPPNRPIREAVVETTVPQPGRSESRPVPDRWFGFDTPRRDYRAEREARRARLDARMEWDRERERDRPRRYWSDQGRDRAYDRDRREDEGRWREPHPRRDEYPAPDRWD